MVGRAQTSSPRSLHILGFLLELSKILIKRALTIGSQLTIMCRQGRHDTVIFHAWKALKVNEMSEMPHSGPRNCNTDEI